MPASRPRSIETEIKARVPGLGPVRARLRRLGARREHPRALEANTLYDDAARSLRARGSTLRVRAYGRGGALTYKGPTSWVRGAKSRPEIETAVSEPRVLALLLASLGYEAVFRYEKKREVWRVGGTHVCLDETPLGPYVEVEGALGAVERVAARLELPRPWVPESYPGLWAASGRSGDMTFERRPRRAAGRA